MSETAQSQMFIAEIVQEMKEKLCLVYFTRIRSERSPFPSLNRIVFPLVKIVLEFQALCYNLSPVVEYSSFFIHFFNQIFHGSRPCFFFSSLCSNFCFILLGKMVSLPTKFKSKKRDYFFSIVLQFSFFCLLGLILCS